MLSQVSLLEHVVVELLELHSNLDHVLIVVLCCFSIDLLDGVELVHQCGVHGRAAVHQIQGLHDAAQRAVPIVHRHFGSVPRVPFQCTHDGIPNELSQVTLTNIVIDVTSPVIIGDGVV